MLHSGSQVSLGGGDPLQLRDIKGESDKEGFITAPPVHKPEEMTEDPDFLFRDHTDWSVMDNAAQAPYRYNERDLHRAYADNCFATREFLMANYVRMGRIYGTHGNGGMSRARRAVCFLMEGTATDIKAGTVSTAGCRRRRRQLEPFRATADGRRIPAPSARARARTAPRSPGRWSSARVKRASSSSFTVTWTRSSASSSSRAGWSGIRASYSPRMDPVTGARLESLWQNGNIDERTRDDFHQGPQGGRHRRRRARRQSAVPQHVLCRRAESPLSCRAAGRCWARAVRMRAASSPECRVGANLAGMQQNLSYASTFHIPGILATRDLLHRPCFRVTRRSRSADRRASSLARKRSST